MIYDLARVRAECTPDKQAVVLNDQSVTYGELEQTSNRLAGALIEFGLLPGDRIALCMDKTPMAVTAMLGVSKAGGIVVPVDVQNPPDRFKQILKSADPVFILTDEKGVKLCLSAHFDHQHRISWIHLGQQGLPADISNIPLMQLSDLDSFKDVAHASVRNENSPLHILFTSGSTGQPKGVVITHRNVLTFLNWAVPYFDMTPDSRVSCHSPLHFDLSTFDLYGTMMAGCTVYLIPSYLNVMPAGISNFILQNHLTQWFSVPSILSYMARNGALPESGFPSLQHLIWCGEVFSGEDLGTWLQRLPGVTFTNLYGPTEATIASSFYRVESASEALQDIPIGRACDGEELLILDEHLNQVEDGVQGDLYISGEGLSPGYWRDSEKTETQFIHFRQADGAVRRIYKTGDLATRRMDGMILFHGRSDYQIKSRGYRIELGEIETALADLTLLREFAVVPVHMNGFEGTAIGCAYVASAQGDITPAALRKHLKQKVPHYMIPQLWEAFGMLPRNSNGKIDRKKAFRPF
jgi:amino acid adenylation domain-containing protein